MNYEVLNSRSNTLIMFRGYTYCMRGASVYTRYCSSKRKGCVAKLRLDTYGNIIYMLLTHNHPKPQYHRNINGDLVKF